VARAAARSIRFGYLIPLRSSETQSSACCQRASACSRAEWACSPAAGYEPRNFTSPCLACSSRSASATNSSSM